MTHSMYPCLWFDGQAKAAAEYYCSIFKSSKITAENPIVVNFELLGNKFMALNGGPKYKFTPATSFVIECQTQEEIDYYWEKLTADGGKEVQCGWLADKYGLSWQVVPSMFFNEWAKDPAGLQRVMHELMQMVKLDLPTLQKAYDRK